jgi:hypothetical protein
MVIGIILENKAILSKLMVIVVIIVLFIINGFRYNRLTYAMLKERWGNEPIDRKIKRKLWVLFYIVFSSIIFFGLAIYLGSKPW